MAADENRPLPRPAPRRVQALRWLLGALLVVAALSAGLWGWSGREGSLATALAWAQDRGDLGLQAQEVSGSLRQGGHIGLLSWQQGQGGLRVEARQVALRWDLADLLRSAWAGQPELHLQHVQAQALRLEPGHSPESGAAPASLHLPMKLRVDALQVQHLVWAGKPALNAQNLAGRYRYDGQAHHAEMEQLKLAQGRYQGQATLGADAPLRLQAQVQGTLSSAVPGSPRELDLALQAQAEGTLSQFDVQARLDSPQAGVRSRAELQARVAPWQSPPLPQARVQVQDLNLATLWPQAPATRLSGQARIEPQAAGWHFAGEWRNATPGPWDRGGLPLDALQARGQWRDGAWLIESLQARLGDAQVQLQGRWQGGGPQPLWRAQARFERLDPSRLDSRWPAQALQGQAQATQETGRQGALRFELRLQGAASGPWQLAEAQAQGAWQHGQIQLDQLQLRSREARLQGSGRWHLAGRRGQGQWQLQAPGLQASARGAWPLAQGAGELSLQVGHLAQAQRWLRGLPGLPAPLAGRLAALRVQGQGDLRLDWPAGLADANVQARLDLPVFEGLGGPDWRELHAGIQGRLSQAQVQLQARSTGPRPFQAQARGSLALPPASLRQALAGEVAQLGWTLNLAQLELALEEGSGRWTLRNPQPLALSGGWQEARAEAGQLQLQAPPRLGSTPVLLAWQSLRWQAGQFQSAGRFGGLPLSWAEWLAGPLLQRAGMQGDLLFDGQWDVQLGTQLKVQAELRRRSGDLSLHAETGQGLAARVGAGIREARLSLDSEGSELVLGWRWDSERAGQSQGRLRTQLQSQDGRWTWPADAPLGGQLQASLPRLGVWSALAPPGWRLRGSLSTQLALGGTRAQPQLSGPLQADDLALRSVVDGIELGRGRLRAVLEGDRLRLDEFSLQGPGAQGGSLRASGEARWNEGVPQVAVQARLERLRASVRRDLQLTVSGELQARMKDLPQRQPVEIGGALRLDQARIRLPDESRPQLDSDVVLRGSAPSVAAAPGPTPGALDLAVRLDLGEDFQIEGKGLQARLRGSLAVTGDALGAMPRLNGTITTASGEYRAYGQRLDIERGLLRFSGAADNPTLDILALRPHLTQRVGVQVTGTALLPRVRLYAEPDLPEAEKLAWLVLGRAGAAGGAEAAVLQQAAIALLGDRSALNRGGLAASLGLDELSLRTAGSQADGSATAGAITFGKRLSSNFYAAYQSSLSGAVGTLFLFYDLSQRWTVRAQTGAQTAMDLIYTLPYD